MDYNIKPLGRVCSATGQALMPGSTCYSALVFENGKLARLDFSEEAWNGPPDDVFAWWKCLVPDARPAQQNPLDPDALFEYFERLSESPNDFQEKMRYVLALLLVRKRRLQIEGMRTDGDDEFVIFSGTHGEGTFEVRDPDLTDAEIEQLQTQLTPSPADVAT